MSAHLWAGRARCVAVAAALVVPLAVAGPAAGVAAAIPAAGPSTAATPNGPVHYAPPLLDKAGAGDRPLHQPAPATAPAAGSVTVPLMAVPGTEHDPPPVGQDPPPGTDPAPGGTAPNFLPAPGVVGCE